MEIDEIFVNIIVSNICIWDIGFWKFDDILEFINEMGSSCIFDNLIYVFIKNIIIVYCLYLIYVFVI